MPKFSYDDIVVVSRDADTKYRPGFKAWVVGIFEERSGGYLSSFPDEPIYTIEFEDGDSLEVNESLLIPYQESGS